MNKPNIDIPSGFAENGKKEDFPNDKILNGFDPINPDILPGDCLNKFIDDTYKASNYALDLGDYVDEIDAAKVNKSGDTMTGDLNIAPPEARGIITLRNRNLNGTSGVAPSSTQQFGILQYRDENNSTMGYVQVDYYSSNNIQTSIGTIRPINGTNKDAFIGCRIDINGDDYFEASNGVKSDVTRLSAPSGIRTEIANPVSDGQYTAPNEGYYYLTAITTSIFGYVYLGSTGIANQCSTGVNSQTIHTVLRVGKGAQVSISFVDVKNVKLYFVKAIGG